MGIRITGLNLGYQGVDYEMLVFPHPEVTLRTSRRTGEKVWYQCPVMCYIIEHPDGLILWETGMSSNWRDEWPVGWQETIDLSGFTPDVCLEARLALLKRRPEDFRYLFLGHLHSDHAGGARLFRDAGAEIVCHEEEYKYVQSIRDADEFFVRADWGFLSERKPTTVYGDTEILKNVRLISLPGHTAGTMGLMAKLDQTGWIMLTSDALFTHINYGPPAIGSPVAWDQRKSAESIEKLRKLAVDHDAFIFPGHDEVGVTHSAGEIQAKKIRFFPEYTYE